MNAEEIKSDIIDLLRVTRPFGQIAKLNHAPTEKEILALVVAWEHYAKKYGVIKTKKAKS